MDLLDSTNQDAQQDPLSLDEAIGLLDTDRPRAFSVVYHATIRRVYGYIVRRVTSAAVAEDITSETYMTLVDAIDKFDRTTKIESFIIGIARNKILQYARSNPAWILLETDMLQDFSPTLDPWEALEKEESMLEVLRPQLEEILGRLSGQESQVLRLRFQEVLSPAEVAERLGTSPGNVRVIQRRALKKAAEHATTLLDTNHS